MADSSSDDGCDSDIADFVESFQVDSDDGELPLPSEPQLQPQPEPELQPDRSVEDKTSMRSGCTLDDDRQLAAQLQRWLPDRAGKPCRHAPMAVSVQQAGMRCTGGWVWEGAKELDAYLLHSVETFAGLHVLELGAGVGWLAQRLASVGARVVATEQAAMLPTLHLNVAKNNARFTADETSALECAELDWLDVLECTATGEPREPTIETLTRQVGGWDLIVGSDCVYMQEFFGMRRYHLSWPVPSQVPCASSVDRLACVSRSAATHTRFGSAGNPRHML